MSEDKEKKEKRDNRQFIRVYKDFMEDNKYDSRDQFVYLLLKGFADQRFEGVSIASVDSILRVLGFVVNTRNKNGIRESIDTLIEHGAIKMYDDFSCTNECYRVEHWNTYFFKIEDEEFAESYFTKVYHEDLNKFLKMDEKNKMKVFLVYYNIISRMYDSDSSDKYTLPNIEDISDETGVNRKTVPKYIKALMENELIYYESIRKAKDKTKNVYGRWEHKEYVRSFARSQWGNE
ncbi:hypothetical protein P4639_21925 [Priestia megaterium]|uniref:hypothetical protein n=1 Tax=Priestia megaterium TaxID=1404 RepID=UPI002E1EC78C|nr:hypothetical protein [Priestia megaterium]